LPKSIRRRSSKSSPVELATGPRFRRHGVEVGVVFGAGMLGIVAPGEWVGRGSVRAPAAGVDRLGFGAAGAVSPRSG
jgi:hypothetical protein